MIGSPVIDFAGEICYEYYTYRYFDVRNKNLFVANIGNYKYIFVGDNEENIASKIIRRKLLL